MVIDVGEEQKKNTASLPFGTNSYKIQKLYKKHKFQEKCSSVKFELERYFAKNFDDDDDDDVAFNILNWWRVNSIRYRVLSMMARDVLVVPISTVTSESAFSTGGRMLNTFRSSLTPLTVEALICAQDWFRVAPLLSEVEERIDELELIESEFFGASKQTSVNVNDGEA